jgi:hypothetical protein
LIEWLLYKQLYQGIAKSIARPANASIQLFLRNHHVSEHRARLCLVSTRTHAGQPTNDSWKFDDMNDNRLGAVALILGAVSGIITLIFHPAGGPHHVAPTQIETLIAVVVGVHVLAIVGLPFSFLGALALSRGIDSPRRLAVMALVIYGFSLVAIMSAATMSGLVTPGIIRRMVAHDAASDQWRALMHYTHNVNQGFAQIGTVGSSIAIVLWSISIVGRRLFPIAIGIYGILLGLAILIALFAGALNLELHGFRIITLSQAIWFILAAIFLWRLTPEPSTEEA